LIWKKIQIISTIELYCIKDPLVKKSLELKNIYIYMMNTLFIELLLLTTIINTNVVLCLLENQQQNLRASILGKFQTECSSDSQCPSTQYCSSYHSCTSKKYPGMACTHSNECRDGLNCMLDSQDCEWPRNVGAVCHTTYDCNRTISYCSMEEICKAKALNGETCGDGVIVCANGLSCNSNQVCAT
jgi:hypothetical protein